ncbi:MAG: radical SAM protein [Candidatus Helarchaeota archaeon]
MFSLDLCITDKCNQQCPHCYVNPTSSMEEMTTAQVLDLLTESSELGAQNFHIFGGEPFLRDDLEEILNYANDLNFSLSIATNGLHLLPHLGWLQKLNLFVGITLHGPKEFHDSFTGTDGGYSTALYALKTALKVGINVGVVTCITQLNYQLYFPWMKSLVDLNIPTFFLIYFSPLGRGANLDVQISNEEWNTFFQTLNEYISNAKKPSNFYFERSIIPKTNILFSQFSYPCALYSKTNCVADANGDIYPCILFLRNPNFRLGSFKTNSLHEIWDRSTREFWKPKIHTNSKCNQCSYLRICNSGCPAYHRYGLDFRCDDKNIPLCPLYTLLL